MKKVPITDALLEETNLFSWFKLRKKLDGKLSRAEYLITILSLFLFAEYMSLVLFVEKGYPLIELRDAANLMIDTVTTTAGSVMAVLLPSFAIFMALGQTNNVIRLANIEDEITKLNYLKKVIFPFVYASIISLCVFFFAIYLKYLLKFTWPSIAELQYWPTSILLCSIYLCILLLIMVGCVLKDFLFNMVHIVIFIVINTPSNDDAPPSKETE